MDSPPQVLVVSYAFPPLAEVGSLRPARFCKYLPEYGITPVVLTIQECFLDRRDNSIPPPGLRVERTAAFHTPLEVYKRWKTSHSQPINAGEGSETILARKCPSFMRSQILAMLQTPQKYWGWYWPAVRAATKLIRQERFAAILSSGPPWISHLIARRLKNDFGLPWLADFRDPWAINLEERHFPRWWWQLNAKLEASCIKRADLVLCNTDRIRDFYLKRYPKVGDQKIVTLTGGFDEVDTAPIPRIPKQSGRVFLHLGSLYARRRIDTFCEAVCDLLRRGKLDPTSFKILFLGDDDPAWPKVVQQRTPELIESQLIEFRPRVSAVKAQQILWNSDLLLLFQGDFSLQVPAKFFEYLLTGKPIFAVAKPGALTDLLDSTGSGIWADSDDSADIAVKLLCALELPVRPPQEVRNQWSTRFHYRPLTARLAEYLREHANGVC